MRKTRGHGRSFVSFGLPSSSISYDTPHVCVSMFTASNLYDATGLSPTTKVRIQPLLSLIVPSSSGSASVCRPEQQGDSQPRVHGPLVCCRGRTVACTCTAAGTHSGHRLAQ